MLEWKRDGVPRNWHELSVPTTGFDASSADAATKKVKAEGTAFVNASVCKCFHCGMVYCRSSSRVCRLPPLPASEGGASVSLHVQLLRWHVVSNQQLVGELAQGDEAPCVTVSLSLFIAH